MKEIIGLGLAAGVSTGAYLVLRKKALDYDAVWPLGKLTPDAFVRANLLYAIGTVQSAPYSRKPFMTNFDGNFTRGEISDLSRLCETYRMVPIYYYRYREFIRYSARTNVNVTPHCMGAFFITSPMYDEELPKVSNIYAPTPGTPFTLLANYHHETLVVEQEISIPMLNRIEAQIRESMSITTEKMYFRHITFPVMSWQWDPYKYQPPTPETKSTVRRETADFEWLEKKLDGAFIGHGPTYAKNVESRNATYIDTLLPSFNDLKRPVIAAFLDKNLRTNDKVLVHEWYHGTSTTAPLPHITFSTNDRELVNYIQRVYQYRSLGAISGLQLIGFTGKEKNVACNGEYCITPDSMMRQIGEETRLQLKYGFKPVVGDLNVQTPYLYLGVLWFKPRPGVYNPLARKSAIGIRWTPGETLMYELMDLIATEKKDDYISDTTMSEWRDEAAQDRWDRREK